MHTPCLQGVSGNQPGHQTGPKSGLCAHRQTHHMVPLQTQSVLRDMHTAHTKAARLLNSLIATGTLPQSHTRHIASHTAGRIYLGDKPDDSVTTDA